MNHCVAATHARAALISCRVLGTLIVKLDCRASRVTPVASYLVAVITDLVRFDVTVAAVAAELTRNGTHVSGSNRLTVSGAAVAGISIPVVAGLRALLDSVAATLAGSARQRTLIAGFDRAAVRATTVAVVAIPVVADLRAFPLSISAFVTRRPRNGAVVPGRFHGSAIEAATVTANVVSIVALLTSCGIDDTVATALARLTRKRTEVVRSNSGTGRSATVTVGRVAVVADFVWFYDPVSALAADLARNWADPTIRIDDTCGTTVTGCRIAIITLLGTDLDAVSAPVAWNARRRTRVSGLQDTSRRTTVK